VQVCQQTGVQIGFHIHDNKQLMSNQCRECQPLEKLENICSGNNDAREKIKKNISWTAKTENELDQRSTF